VEVKLSSLEGAVRITIPPVPRSGTGDSLSGLGATVGVSTPSPLQFEPVAVTIPPARKASGVDLGATVFQPRLRSLSGRINAPASRLKKSCRGG